MGFSLKGVVKKVGGAVKSVGRAVDVTSSKSLVRKVGRAADITSTKSPIGKFTAPIARPLVATAKVGIGVTGLEWAASKVVGGRVGAALKADVKRTLPEAVKGYKIGAGVGLGILAGKSAADLAKGAITSGFMPPPKSAVPSTTLPPSTIAATSTGAAPGGLRRFLRFAFPGIVA